MEQYTQHTSAEHSPVARLDLGAAPQPLKELAAQGLSVWLDDLNRPMIREGRLAELVRSGGVVGVTTNPSIFAKALSEAADYDEQVRQLAAEGVDVDEAVFRLTTTDVAEACDLLRPVWEATDGQDGRVSIEVDPRLAADTAGTVEMAQRLWDTIDRPNLLIKIPATVQGLPAITEVISRGISVNVTLIFSLDRYRGVMNAYLTGLEQAREKGVDLAPIHSVASFFVSRVDSEVDARLEAIGTDEARALRSRAGLANARLAYQAFDEVFSTPRWATLADDGANLQRPLWASTSVKDESLPDTLYVTGLVAPNTVNTMPTATLEATADHGEVTGDTVQGTYAESAAVLDGLEAQGISYLDVVETLETEGVKKFADAWDGLLASVQEQLDKAKG
ncbi:transaldolase [Kytococcus aerolatus]|uniref:Transaldolase n=1 Tax=Kytococcus aerolatus TaxID=592308 RepID=A0A212T0Y3_9MICO|nr:transaldolase [Kytococcus aerolatus]SNC59526.1 transaldolase [Kytococcus aerolatus]